MERAVAVKKLAQLLGKNMGYRVNPKAPTAEERQAAKEALPALSAALHEAQKAMHDRRERLLAEDSEYQTLIKTYEAAENLRGKTRGITSSYKFTVGTSMSVGGLGMFNVRAEGDSWEEVIAKLQTKVRA